MDIMTTLANEISHATGQTVQLTSSRQQGGGSINQTLKISGDQQDFFVKLNHPDLLDMFIAETAGLQELEQTGNFSVPKAICSGKNQEYSWLVLEYLELGSRNKTSFAEAGRALARQHQSIQKQFGWHRNNTIGSTPQVNTYTDSWGQFWQKYRFGYQLQLAKQNGYSGPVIEHVERLIDNCEKFFTHAPEASLLHGDLWSGNLAFDRQGKPVIYDPAVYYGDREADLAMTELFGGFSPDFYAAYNQTWPIDAGYSVRKTLYNLYHILNHMNLFGGGYHNQAVSMASRLLGELG